MLGLLSRTFSDKPIRYPHRLTHNIQRGGVQSLMWQRSLTLVPSQQLWQVEGQGLWLSCFGSCLRIIYLRCSAYMVLTRWDAHQPLKLGAINSSSGWGFCDLGQSHHTLRAFPICASWHYYHGSPGIHFMKFKKSSILYTYPSSQLGIILTPRDIWQCRETVTTRSSYWHQRCWYD